MAVPRLRVLLAVAFAAFTTAVVQARAAVPHTVQAGETLWSIAASNNFTTRTIAAFNGLSEDSQVHSGETIEIPTEAEGATALAAAGSAGPGASVGETWTGTPATAVVPAMAPPPGSELPWWTAPIYCPCGEVHLASNAAAAWNAMREESLRLYGIDLYPAGTLSGYRSYAQQSYLRGLYLSGRGSPAALPGTSAHEYGVAVDLADPSMAVVIDQLGARYGWAKVEAPGEWWHVNYVGP